jgi:hypothetical protein
VTSEPSAAATRVQHAKRLFEFLGRVQQLKTTPVRTAAKYETVI